MVFFEESKELKKSLAFKSRYLSDGDPHRHSAATRIFWSLQPLKPSKDTSQLCRWWKKSSWPNQAPKELFKVKKMTSPKNSALFVKFWEEKTWVDEGAGWVGMLGSLDDMDVFRKGTSDISWKSHHDPFFSFAVAFLRPGRFDSWRGFNWIHGGNPTALRKVWVPLGKKRRNSLDDDKPYVIKNWCLSFFYRHTSQM